jgi:NhaP-type Na+/H+ or K+/H+ antiporter
MPEVLFAAARGFAFADTWAIGLIFCGVAVFAGIGALSHQHERAFSASLIYLALGVFAAVLLEVLHVRWLDPVDDAELLEKLSEQVVIFALFATGLKLDRPFTWAAWAGVARLLAVAMPLTILGVAWFGHAAMGLSWGAAVLLGAVLSPTDPVLAGDIGVGPPGEGDEREPNFSITGEAGLNDGLAFPFLFAGLFLLDPGGTAWIGEWFLADVLWAIVVGAMLGAAIGYGLAALARRLRGRGLLADTFDGWLAIPTVLVIYGVTEVAGAYGFIAAFTGGLAFRRHEKHHDLNIHVHRGVEVVEKFGELAVVLLLGSMISLRGLALPGVSGWLLAPLLLLVIRPIAVFIAMIGKRLPLRQQLFVAWFGVRGIGSFYYAVVAVQAAQVYTADAAILVWTTLVVMLVSIVAHGVTASPLGGRLLAREAPQCHAGTRGTGHARAASGD